MLVWLENAYSRPFLRFFGGTFSPNDVTHRPNLQKDHPWAEPRHLMAMIGLSCTATRDIARYMSKIVNPPPPYKLPRRSPSLFNRPLPNLVNI